MKKKLLIIITRGFEDNGLHATLGFVLAMNTLTFGNDVTVFLTGEGVIWGYVGESDKVQQKYFPPLKQMMEDFTAKEGKLLVCSSCSRSCPIGMEMLPGAEIGGLASIVPNVMGGQTLVF